MKTGKFIIVTMAVATMAMVSCSQGGQKQENKATETKNTVEVSSITIDPGQSKVMWAGTMLGIYTHEGTLQFQDADLSMADGEITGGSFTVDLNTIVPTDENYNPEQGSTPEKLVGHLKSADFFDVENHPTASFRITGVEDNTLKGMMTIRGITHEEKVENISMTPHGDAIKIAGEMTIDRKKYDVSWDSSVKERVLSNDIKLKIQLIGS